MKTNYETERLKLRILDEKDVDMVVDYLIRNKGFFSMSEPERDDNYYSAEFQINLLKTDLKYINNGDMLRLWVFEKCAPGRIVGQITFYNIVPYAFLSCHIGYKSDEDIINRGIITEAVKYGINIMFEEYGMHRIEAYVLQSNTASIRVLEKTGFLYEGVAKEFLEVNGKWEDHLHYVLINNRIGIDS